MLGEGDMYGGISMLVNDGIAIRTLRVSEDSYFYILPKEMFLEACLPEARRFFGLFYRYLR